MDTNGYWMCVEHSEQSSSIPTDFITEITAGLKPVELTRVCIFGSAVEEGIAAEDIDILILSKDFAGVHFTSREEMVLLPNSHYFDVRPYTPDEFERLCPRGHPFRESIESQHIDITPEE
jgi:hypothetical protein